MRECLRCNVPMVEDLDVKIEKAAYGIKVTEVGIFKDNLGKLRCAVCPECGYTELYVKEPEMVKKLVPKKKK